MANRYNPEQELMAEYGRAMLREKTKKLDFSLQPATEMRTFNAFYGLHMAVHAVRPPESVQPTWMR